MSGVDPNLEPDHRPQRPAVVPRASLVDGDLRMPLDQLVAPLLDRGRGLICITAPAGGGKTCALHYLRYALSNAADVQFFDDDSIDAAREAAKAAIAILAVRCVDPGWNPRAVFKLRSWTPDDCIEYLAHHHRGRLPEVINQLIKDPMTPALRGSPELLALVMDELATAPVVLSIGRGMRLRVLALDVSQDIRDLLIGERLRIENNKAAVSWRCVDVGQLPGWFRHEAPQRCWIGEEMAERFGRFDFYSSCMKEMRGRAFIDDIAAAVSRNHDARKALETLVSEKPKQIATPMAASILLRVDPAWRPLSRRHYNFRGAILRKAQWQGIDLQKANLHGADCAGADFTDINLSKAHAQGADFTGTCLREAQLYGADISKANLRNANLRGAYAYKSKLMKADLAAAKCTDADLRSAWMDDANLSGADFSNATLKSAIMERVVVDGANFTGADFTGARLKGVNMSDATLTRVCFYNAIVRSCNLEGLDIAEADFRKADLTRSLFTGSRIIGGNFEGASLEAAGLAEIEWTGANLQRANLSNASFHLGSSRSGLVGSTIPCEGSRTGFYTDEYNEQTYKSAEEIRKACLCRADLRGAILTHTDFYLVDLCRARYTDDQRQHFQRCGAILVSRVPD